MKALKAIVTEASYQVPVTVADMHNITAKQNEAEKRAKLYSYAKIYLTGKLDALAGVHSAECNGHFGANVFFTVEGQPGTKKHDATVRRALAIIQKYRV